jgi:hypothetical protein
MTKYFYILFLLLPICGYSQNELHWSEDYQLTVADYEAPAPNNGTLQTVSGNFYVAYEMGGLNLITTRNLNENVSCYFQKDESFIGKEDKADTKLLLRYQQLIFNLYELQARNLRRKFFDDRTRLLTKGPSVLHQEALADHKKLLAQVEEETNHGYRSEVITEWLTWTSEELEKLSDFCKTCKPRKKNKRDE